jgi:hypothetical protein
MSVHFVYVKETGSTPTPDEWAGLGTNVAKLFTAPRTSFAIGAYFPWAIDRGGNKADWLVYDLTDHLDGSDTSGPVAQGTWTVPTISTTGPWPEGSSVCLSFRADYGTDPEFVRDPVTHKVTHRPRANKRNRMYIPINAGCATTNTNNASQVNPTMASDLLQMAASAANQSDSTTGTGNTWKWKVWSVAKGLIYDVVLAWVGNRLDYQRRRSDQDSTRQIAAISETFIATHGAFQPFTEW